MNTVKKYVAAGLLLTFCLAANAGFLSKVFHFLSNVPLVGKLTDSVANKKAHKEVDKKIAALNSAALTCKPLESDHGKTVKDWMKLKPGYPDWKALEKLESVSEAAKTYAQKSAKHDKVQHCFAGCYIRKKLGYSTSVLVAWLKELKDASDCNSNSHFEEADYVATIAGAKTGDLLTCEKFCGSTQNLTGSEMLKKTQMIRSTR